MAFTRRTTSRRTRPSSSSTPTRKRVAPLLWIHSVCPRHLPSKSCRHSTDLTCLGERLYIATEGPGRVPAYTLRQYDVRNSGNGKAAAQQVKLKPFAGSPDRACTEINSLSLSPDGIYLAVGRSDNWVDVYDSRMLQRRELHSFAHEGGGPDTYGVVKTQWVDGYPFGFGLVSGGVDGTISLENSLLFFKTSSARRMYTSVGHQARIQ